MFITTTVTTAAGISCLFFRVILSTNSISNKIEDRMTPPLSHQSRRSKTNKNDHLETVRCHPGNRTGKSNWAMYETP